jgi:hypothetical protein
MVTCRTKVGTDRPTVGTDIPRGDGQACAEQAASFASASALRWCLQVNVQQLAALTKLVRGELSQLARRALVALITVDVHARDIVESLVVKRVSSAMGFDWQMQLRYYWEEDDLVVRQVGGFSARR